MSEFPLLSKIFNRLEDAFSQDASSSSSKHKIELLALNLKRIISKVVTDLKTAPNFSFEKFLKKNLYGRVSPFGKLKDLKVEQDFHSLLKVPKSLHPHITDALGTIHSSLNFVGDKWTLFNKTKRFYGNETLNSSLYSLIGRDMELIGSHRIGDNSDLEAILKAKMINLNEFRLRLRKMFQKRIVQVDPILYTPQINLCFDFATNVVEIHKFSIESEFGNSNDENSFSAIFSKTVNSKNLLSESSWGVGSCHRLNSKCTIFSRYSDDNSMKKLLLQTVLNLDEKNTLSPIVALLVDRHFQFGITWKHMLSKKNNVENDECFQVRLLCNRNGSYVLNFKCQFREKY